MMGANSFESRVKCENAIHANKAMKANKMRERVCVSVTEGNNDGCKQSLKLCET